MTNRTTFQEYASMRSTALYVQGRKITANHYDVAMNRFTKAVGFVPIRKLSSEHIMKFDETVRSDGVTDNTAMFYMRTLKAIYNHAVNAGFIDDKQPFKHVRCGVAKTKKRAITEKQLKAINDMVIEKPVAAFSRDMFILSFLLRGMSPVDMTKMTKKNVVNGGWIVYKRSKTGKELRVNIVNDAKEILNRYKVEGSDKLLPFESKDLQKVNRHLKDIGNLAGVAFPLTMYCARHTWASLSRSHNIPISVISSGMGHSDNRITEIYLSEIETDVVDKYNNKLINSIFK